MELRERLSRQARGHGDAQAAAWRSLQLLTYVAELETEAVLHGAGDHGRSQRRHQIVELDLVAETQVYVPGGAVLPTVSQFQRKPALQHPRWLLAIQSLQQSFERDPLLEPLRERFEPIMSQSDQICDGIGYPVELRLGAETVVLDFPKRAVREPIPDEKFRYGFAIAPELVRTVLRDEEPDWVNTIFLSTRFAACEVVLGVRSTQASFAFGFRALNRSHSCITPVPCRE